MEKENTRASIREVAKVSPDTLFLSAAFIRQAQKKKIPPNRLEESLDQFLRACAVPPDLLARARHYQTIANLPPEENNLFPIEVLGAQMAIATQAKQEIERYFESRREISRQVIGTGPIYNLAIGDLHVGHIATDFPLIIRLRNAILDSPRTVITCYGDEIEGWAAKYASTVLAQSLFDFRAEIFLFKEMFLKPLARAGKVLSMVSNYPGHLGWGMSESTIDVWRFLVEDLGIPLITAGGTVTLKWGTGKRAPEQRLLITHIPGRYSKIDPLFGIREIANEFPNDHPNKPDMVGGAHVHKAAIGQELSMGGPKEPKRKLTLTLTGTAKSSNPNLPSDRHTTMFLGRLHNDPLGTGTIQGIQKENGKKSAPYIYPTASFTAGDTVFRSLLLLDKTESAKQTQELLDLIHRRIEKAPSIQLSRSTSREVPTPHDESSEEAKFRGRQSPQFDKASWKIFSQLPIFVEMIAHTRIGSESFEQFRQYLQKEIARLSLEPHSFAILGRHISDPDVAGAADREEKLEDIVRFFSPLGEKRKLLALMLSGSLRTKQWKKHISDNPPIRPGTYLSKNLNTPLLHHKSLLELAVGGNQQRQSYLFALADHLDWSGSTKSPTQGLSRMYWDDASIRPDVYVGGHNPKAGWMIRYDRNNFIRTCYPAFMQPGWWSQWQERGKSNSRYGSPGGQGFVLMPNEKQLYPTLTIEDSIMLHQSLTLLTGLDILNMTERVMHKTKP